MDRALTIIDLFDEISRDTDIAIDVIPALHDVIKELLGEIDQLEREHQSLTEKLNDAKKESSSQEKQLKTARRLLDEEKLKRKRVEDERNHLENQLDLVRELLYKDSRNKINDETKEKLNLLTNRRSIDALGDRLDTITELETTGSVMSDLSYTRDEDELLSSSGPETRSHKRSSSNPPEYTKPKKRRTNTIKVLDDNDRLVATTTVTMGHSGPVRARSVIETMPKVKPGPLKEDVYQPSAPPLTDSSDTENDVCQTPSNKMLSTRVPFSMNLINTRAHTFQQKPIIRSELCNVCCKRVKFSAMAVKCKECKTVCHLQCKDGVPVPCVPINTPTSKGTVGSIGDYTPQVGLMVPSLVVHCVKEIEARGLTEVGLYRIPGSDKEVKNLKEKFLRGRGVPNLPQIPDVHTICGCLKDFLRSLKEPLITQIRWKEFSKAADLQDVEDRRARLYQLISELPQPNRDTLSYLVIHLQKVAESPNCKMPIPNLAKMFGPSIVGFSRLDLENALSETNQANKIMDELLSMPMDYWENVLKISDFQGSENDMHKTPSTNSLKNFFSPNRGRKKYFDTP